MKKSAGSSLFQLLLLPVRPWTLPGIAERASTRAAVIAGTLTALLLVGFLMSAPGIARAEPFPQLSDYLVQVVLYTPLIGLFMIPLATPIWIYFLILWATSSSEHRSPRARVFSRCLLLNHIPLTIPLVVWGAANALRYAAHWEFSLLDTPKAEWIYSAWIGVIAEPWSALPIAFIYVGSAIYSWNRLAYLTAPGQASPVSAT